MTSRMKVWSVISILLLVVAMPAFGSGVSGRHEIKYVGEWHVQPNGDVKAVRTFTIPSLLYAGWKANNLHMKEMRSFHPAVSTVKVDDLDYKWDDVKRTLTLTMIVRGLASNKGDHWEATMSPGIQFSNIDVGQKKAYFHASMSNPEVTINGQDIVIFPATATDISNVEKQTLRFKMPEAGGPVSASLWWGLFGVSLVAGLALIGVSLVGNKSAQA